MKKTLISILCILALVLSLSACTLPTNDELPRTLSDYAAQQYDSYTVQIVTESPNGGKTTETYEVTVANGIRTANCCREQINPFIIEGNVITPPEEYMTVQEYTVSVGIGETTAFGLPGFRFTEDAVSNLTCNTEVFPYTFKCNVISTEKFMQDSIDFKTMTVEGEYVVGSLYHIQLRYTTTDNHTVTVTYTYN